MYEYNCTIVRVVDGDTVDVDIDLGFDTWRRGERIRLYGVDTPECRSRNAVEKKAGLLAKGFVIQALHEGGTYKLTTKEKGKFGRYLGTIKIDGELTINAALISEHLAVPYSGQNKKEIEAAHKANYKVLKEKGLLC
jgi:micrococcal nuclease